MVKFLMKESNIQSSPNSEGVTPLMVALKEGNTEIVRILLEKENPRRNRTIKGLLEEKDNDEKSVFHYAFGSRKPAEVTQVLVEVCSTIYQQNYSSEMKDFLTMKDLNEDTPFHILVQQKLEKEKFDKILSSLRNIQEPVGDFLQDQLSESSTTDEDHPSKIRTRMSTSEILECMKEKNETKETPLHKAAKNGQTSFVEALLDLNHKFGSLVESTLEHLLTEKDQNANTALHLATQQAKTDHGRTKDVAKVLLAYIRENSKDQIKFLAKKNSFGWTPFSGAVAGGDKEMVEEMLWELSEAEKRALVNQPDFSNSYPLHLAAKYGHVGIFKVLLENKAELTQRGRNQKTALDIAIEQNQRVIIKTIIEADEWLEAFQIPSTSDRGDLDTPLRKLIRSLPDMAEVFLDRCCEEIPPDEKDSSVTEVIKMNADFIEDTHKYKILKGKRKEENTFCHGDSLGLTQTSKEKCEKYQVDINNHPMVIMADERKEDLLQHPLCIAIILKKWSMYRFFYYFQLGFYLIFLLFLNLYAMTSPSPIHNPELFTCTPFFRDIKPSDIAPIGSNSDWNNAYRWILMIIVVVRVILFFVFQEYKPIKNRLEEIEWRKLLKGKNIQSSIKSIPLLFFLDFIVYVLAFYMAIHNFSNVSIDGENYFDVDVRTCGQWQIGAFTVTLAWLNLLFYMRLLYVVGKYIILFQDVLLTFLAVFTVVFILVLAFAAGFYLLLSNRENFDRMGDSLLKTTLMMSGEFDYGEIFFKENPPLGFDDEWDKGHEYVPFPFLTYTLFIVFFFLVSIVALNVLVGLTVDDIRNYLENADRLKLSMRLKYILAAERGSLNSFMKRSRWFGLSDDNETHMPLIKKQREMAVTNDLISKAKIWEKMEKKQEERRRKGELEQDKKDQKDLIHDQTRKIKEFISKKRGIREKLQSNGSKASGRRGFSSRNDRETRTSSFDYEDGDVFELAQNVNAILSYMEDSSKSVEENSESLNEVKKDIKLIIQHLSSEAVSDKRSSQRSSQRHSGSIII